MDTPETLEQQLLRQAERQTKTLQGLYNMGLVWSAVAVLAVITWIFIAANG